jgi:hypothetical protein
MKKLPPGRHSMIKGSWGKSNGKGGSQMYYTGVDLHKKTSFITSIDPTGKTVKKANIHNAEEAILDYFLSIEEETKIVVESMASWYWLHDLLSERDFDIVICNPINDHEGNHRCLHRKLGKGTRFGNGFEVSKTLPAINQEK